jgi:hypothetical protein
MRRILQAAILLFLAAAPTPAGSHSHREKGLEIVHPWTAETTEPGHTNVAVYMTIKNDDAKADRLLGASTPLADKVDIIDIVPRSGIKLPMAVPALVVPPRGKLVLGVEGPRLLLSGFKKRLTAYDSFKLSLTFERAGRIDVDVMVEQAPAVEKPHKH